MVVSPRVVAHLFFVFLALTQPCQGHDFASIGTPRSLREALSHIARGHFYLFFDKTIGPGVVVPVDVRSRDGAILKLVKANQLLAKKLESGGQFEYYHIRRASTTAHYWLQGKLNEGAYEVLPSPQYSHLRHTD